MDNIERIKELEAALAQVTADRDNLAAQLDEIKNSFDFQSAMQRIEARKADAEQYRQQMQAAFDEALHTPTQFI